MVFVPIKKLFNESRPKKLVISLTNKITNYINYVYKIVYSTKSIEEETHAIEIKFIYNVLKYNYECFCSR